MKKLFGVFVLGILMFSMLGTFVSADDEIVGQIQGGITDAYKVIEPVLEFAVGETGDAPELFFAKILLAIIIFGIVWMALNKIGFLVENTWVLWTITIAVSLLAIRWITDVSVINTIILPYSALGVALTAGIPFIVYFLVVKDFSKTMRKISWIFFIVIYIGLWTMRSGKSAEKTTEVIGGAVGPFAWIYLATAVIALIVLLADKTIQRAVKKSAAEANEEIAKSRRRTQLIAQRHELEDRKLNNQIPDGDYNMQDRDLKKKERKYDII